MFSWGDSSSSSVQSGTAISALLHRGGSDPTLPPRARVRIQGCGEAAFRALLRYLYAGPAPTTVAADTTEQLDATQALDLAVISRRYLLPELAEKATLALHHAIKPADVVPLLLRACKL